MTNELWSKLLIEAARASSHDEVLGLIRKAEFRPQENRLLCNGLGRRLWNGPLEPEDIFTLLLEVFGLCYVQDPNADSEAQDEPDIGPVLTRHALGEIQRLLGQQTVEQATLEQLLTDLKDQPVMESVVRPLCELLNKNG